MITLDNAAGPVYVGTSQGELAFTNAGHWILPDVSYVAFGTGYHSNVTVTAGAVITVDSGGLVRVVNGPDMVGAFGMGFGTCLTVMGFFLFIRWIARVFMGGAGVPNSAAD